MTIVIKGIDTTAANLKRIDKQLSNMRKPMQQATNLVTTAAQNNAPVDTGVLKRRILASVSHRGQTTTGVVGSDVAYAPFMELGTRPHFPPVSALQGWASRHGMNAFVVARTIARRGLKARRYLQRALEDNTKRVVSIFVEAVSKIIKD